MSIEISIDSNVERIISYLLKGGARDCILVGGFVRDYFLGLPSKDYDIEVYGLTYEQIIQILKKNKFKINFVGQSFGTIKVGSGIDISIPRVESKSGVGHRGFNVSCEPNLDLYSAFKRRDFTINAIGIRIDRSIYDPFNGIDDIKNKILRAPTAAFCEDPLRVMRGMQFAARFRFKMETQTIELCKQVCNEFNTLSVERIWNEWVKWGVKGVEPSQGLFLLQKTGWIKHFPEIADLINVTKIHQDDFSANVYSDENAFDNTSRVCDIAVRIADRYNFSDNDRLVLIFSVLCHNLGKSENTIIEIDDLLFQKLSSSVSNIRRYSKLSDSSSDSGSGSDFDSDLVLSRFRLTQRFLSRLKPPLRVVDCILSIVGEVLTDYFLTGKSNIDDRSLRRLAVRIEPSSIRIWAAFCRAIIESRDDTDLKRSLIEQLDKCELRAIELDVIDSKPKPILRGRDLIQFGILPGRKMGQILDIAYELQLDGVFSNIDEAVIWYSNYSR
ncbi:MAG: hypothetical protein LBE18_02395 [Planctomycetaceae bacterium]|jgi:tRNA nucleotidyltransferase (CCA-adding enzyme)|nr:hypothetical protein [Planctomycetaceae bacterium]